MLHMALATKPFTTERRIFQVKRKRWHSHTLSHSHTNYTQRSHTHKKKTTDQKNNKKIYFKCSFILAYIHHFECQMRVFRWITNLKKIHTCSAYGINEMKWNEMNRTEQNRIKRRRRREKKWHHFNNECYAHRISKRLSVSKCSESLAALTHSPLA